jgi:polyisoprenoid-binding protein YceI
MLSKNYVASIFVLLGVLFPLSLMSQQIQSYSLGIDKSTIKWTGRKILGSHHGYVGFKTGYIKAEGNRIIEGAFEVDMSTISVRDIEDKEMNQKLVKHLKSEDFFSVDKFPTAKFLITHVTQIKNAKSNESNFAITGKMTIKGITHTVVFPALVKAEGNVIRAKAKFEIDRTKFDVRYKSGSFFENLGDNLIYDNFTLELNLVFSKQ